MNERNARVEHNTQYSVPPVFDEELGRSSQGNKMRIRNNVPAGQKSPQATTSSSDARNDTDENNQQQREQDSG